MAGDYCIIDLEAARAEGRKWLLGPFRPASSGEQSGNLEIGYVNLDAVADSDRYHFHTLSEEYFVVLSGGMRIQIEEEEVEVKAGQVLLIRPHIGHIMRAVEPATRILLIKSPPGPN